VTCLNGLPGTILSTISSRLLKPPEVDRQPVEAGPEAVTTSAEGRLSSEASDIQEQARQAWSSDHGENLLS